MVKERLHIGVFGERNRGKSTLINALAGQEVAIVSAQAGTTTDPVKKVVEFLDFGPVVLVDTAGMDDEGSLGEERVKRSLSIVDQVDFAILLVGGNCLKKNDISLLEIFKQRKLPYVIVHGKEDVEALNNDFIRSCEASYGQGVFRFSRGNVDLLKELAQYIIVRLKTLKKKKRNVFEGLVNQGDVVMLVTPIDSEAPAGRLILPQVQALRNLLDKHCVVLVLQDSELETYFASPQLLPKLIVTDSQVFSRVNAIVPATIPLTGFSVLLASVGEHFELYKAGTPKVEELKDGDRVLLLESCTHQVSCEDIGRVKLPQWIRKYTNKDLTFEVVSGLESLKRDITEYALVVQCGGCMISQRQLKGRLREALEAGIPVSNYGLMIAYIHGIFERSIAVFEANRD